MSVPMLQDACPGRPARDFTSADIGADVAGCHARSPLQVFTSADIGRYGPTLANIGRHRPMSADLHPLLPCAPWGADWEIVGQCAPMSTNVGQPRTAKQPQGGGGAHVIQGARTTTGGGRGGQERPKVHRGEKGQLRQQLLDKDTQWPMSDCISADVGADVCQLYRSPQD